MELIDGFIILCIIGIIYYIYIDINTKPQEIIPEPAVLIHTEPVIMEQIPIPPVVPIAPVPPVALNDITNKKVSLYSSGTGSDTLLELYPDINYTGWDNNEFNSRINQHKSQATIMPKDIDIIEIPFMIQQNETQNWIYNSMKVPSGTILEFFGIYGYVYHKVGYNISNLKQYFEDNPSLSGDKGGLFMFISLWSNRIFTVKVVKSVPNGFILK